MSTTHPRGTRTGLARIATVLTVGALSSMWLAVPASAVDATGADTFLRLAHLSPDTPSVDVYVTSAADPADNLLLRGVDYGTVSDYQRVDGGSYTISMRPAGADEDTAPVIATTLNAEQGSAHTVAGVGRFADLGLRVLDDDLTLPPTGQSRVRVIQASASQPTLDVALQDGVTLAEDLDFATTTDYSLVPPGEWVLEVSGASSPTTTLPFTVDAGSVYSVLILDQANGGLSVAPRIDAASTGVIPAGSVETGAGGSVAGAGTKLLLFGAGAALLAGTVVTVRRRQTG
ncbi:DUF4397 domain-containing protein [soil metagenome]